MITTEQRRKIGKQNKRKGAAAQTESAQFWSKELNTNMKSTPRSGAFYDWPADIFDMGNSILKDFVIERKFGNQVPKKIDQWMQKLSDESQGKMYFLEMNRAYEEKYVVISRKHFARLLKELQGYKKNEK